MENKIITFSCSNLVYIYEPKCGLLPMFPYRQHKDVESAKKHLGSCGKENIEVKIYKTHGK